MADPTPELRAELETLMSRRAGFATELQDLERRYADSPELPAGPAQRWADIETASDKARDRICAIEAELADRARRLGALRGPNVVGVSGDGAAAVGQAQRGDFSGYTGRFAVNRSRNLEEIHDRSNLNVDNAQHGETYRSKALASIDSWRGVQPEWQESAARLVDDCDLSKRDRQLADHMLSAGNPLYVRAFTKYLKYGPTAVGLFSHDEQEAWADVHQRAMNEGSVSAGQAVVPPMLDPHIILTNVAIVNPFRQLATVKTITTQTWKGVTSAGITAEWAAEAAESTDASPSFTSPSITPIRGDIYCQASFEMIEDTAIASELSGLFADARDRLEGAAMATGPGVTTPYGIVTELNLVTASRTAATTNGSIGLADVFALDNNLPPRFRPNATFTMAKGIANTVRQIAIPSLVNFSPWVDLGSALPPKLIGYPVAEASGMLNTLSTATASSDAAIVLGDFRQGYFVVDRVPMTIALLPLVIGSNRRPTGESGWYAQFRTGARAVIPSAFQMLVV